MLLRGIEDLVAGLILSRTYPSWSHGSVVARIWVLDLIRMISNRILANGPPPKPSGGIRLAQGAFSGRL
jgi:hypothetical protein